MNGKVSDRAGRYKRTLVAPLHPDLLDLFPEPVIAWELDGTITYWNAAAETLYGYDREHALERNVHALLKSDVRRREIRAALEERGHWRGEIVHTAQTGEKILVESRMAVVHVAASDDSLVIETPRPSTERVLREEALRKRVEDLVAADRSKNEFLAVLAHELRNPLSALRNASGVLSEAKRAPSLLDEAKLVIEQQLQQMTRMVDDLLDIARISHGTIQFSLQPLDFTQVIRKAIAATAHLRETGGQEFTLVLPESPLPVLGDAVRLEQLVSNLLGNASKFTGAGDHIWLSLELARSERGEHAQAVLKIRDDGEGIAEAMLAKVFDMFTKADDLPERGRPGLGIGLSLAKRLAEMHGGTIEAHSEGLRRGSEFVVRLPTTQLPLPEKRSAARLTHRPRRVLVIDDNVDTARMMQVLLESEGHTVKLAYDGKDGMQAAIAFQPEMILLDIGLPGRDGYRVAAEIRDEPSLRQVRLIAVTGYGRREDVKQALAASFDDHMTKPVDPTSLLRAVA